MVECVKVIEPSAPTSMATSVISNTDIDVQGLSPRYLPSPGRNLNFTPSMGHRPESHTIDIDEYFHGPMDLMRHSRWPTFLRLHGSVMPKMIVPLVFVGVWSTAVACIGKFVYKNIGISSVLLTVLGFVVGMALSFRSTTAYERYNDGRKYWAQLQLTSRNLARLIWIHATERHDEDSELGRSDLLAKLTALNLINAFAVALKHRLRFEPSTEYPDLSPLIAHLDTFASRADQTVLKPKRPHPFKALGEYLGLSFAISNPRKLLKRSNDNLGNLPLEILNYLGAYLEGLIASKQLAPPIHQTTAMNSVNALADVLTGAERVLNTPLPIAYSIAISQITWIYVLVLPFQLYTTLGMITIPGTVVAAYIILGLAAIGREIENPFGQDVNDLPLDDFCREIAADIDALTSTAAAKPECWIENVRNKCLFPLSMTNYPTWNGRSTEQIREALKAKATTRSKSVMLERTKTMMESDLLEV